MSNPEIAHLEAEIVRLQTENAWDERHINGLHSLVGSLVEELYHYKSMDREC